jgi:hypothetical protein
MSIEQAIESLKPLSANSVDVARFAEFIEKSDRGIIRG